MILEELYQAYVGTAPERVTALTPAGSSRRYYRLAGPVTLVGVVGTQRAENEAFIYLADHFSRYDLPAPRVVAVSHDRMAYLQTDLGDTSLWNCLDNQTLLDKTMRALPLMQTVGADTVDYARCFPVSSFDERAVMWDLNYFKYSYLNLCGISYSEPHLEGAFRTLAAQPQEICDRGGGGLMLRDCQSRNVMICDDEPYFIDFQGARRGPLAYDVASFLWQAKAQFTPEQKRHLIDVYKEAAGELPPDFDQQVTAMALLRTLQVLGAYGFRGLVERKGHFIQSIPYALDNLRTLLDTDLLDLPKLKYLRSVLTDVAAAATVSFMAAPADGLTVRVTSFSYKKGIPLDPSGNGGGFVFDCRAMDNPGRYDQYKPLTGLDAPVREFLESRGQIQRFLTECGALVDAAVDNYLERGFSSLSVCFGCTGGRHRSVYSAEAMALRLKEKYPAVNVILCHREQKIERLL